MVPGGIKAPGTMLLRLVKGQQSFIPLAVWHGAAHESTNRNDCSPAANLVVAEAVARPWLLLRIRLKILLAADDSDCSVGAAHSAANRPWPDVKLIS
jgi:hypothetical protein